jgi:hypothetical protein
MIGTDDRPAMARTMREGNDIAMPVDDLLGGDPAEPYPALDTLLDRNQIDISERVSRNRDHDAAPSSEKARASNSRSISVTGCSAAEGIELKASAHCCVLAPATCYARVVLPPPRF